MSPFFRPKNILAIEINAETLKIAYLRSGGSPQLLGCTSMDIRGQNDDQIIEFIRNYVALNKIKTTEVINVVPGRFTITKNIELPSTDSAEIKQIIQLQAGRHSPYSREEIVIDYIPIGIFKGGYTRVFLVIVNRDYIKRNVDIIERADLRTRKIILATETMAQWYAEQSGSPLGLLQIDSGNLEFSVIHKGKPIFLRIIPLGSTQLLADRDKYAQKFQEEIKHTLESYQAEHLEQLNQLLVTGATDKTDIGNVVKEATGILPKIEKLTDLIPLTPSAEEQKNAVMTDVSFTAVVTSALRYLKTLIDLTPEEVKVQQAMAEKSKDVIWMGTLIVLILVLITAIFTQKIWMKTSFVERLKDVYNASHDKAVDLNRKNQRITSINNYLLQQKLPLESLVELHRLTTDQQVYFETIRYEYGWDKKEIFVRGMANNSNDINNLRDRLEKSAYFGDVKIKSSAIARVKEKELVAFEISCSFELKIGTMK